ncbi:hypothetical protein BT63DRAFT_458762 [Microthyrium microscopicum]|uniref:N-acetylglucosamine-induced protein 1 n=1 Tax=Microthyrium microscopicum TaxID=703497 RepID=A0A6A6U493_9PEZI|nr:hypothetical protein BT63DRAFT_458762 [Microthyrium microscopicum]
MEAQVTAVANKIEYWNVNIPVEEHTVDCPDFLLDCPPHEVTVLSTPEDEFVFTTWNDVTDALEGKRALFFGRRPTVLRRYCKYMYDKWEQYGSYTAPLMAQLGWESLKPISKHPFLCPSDYKIAVNDFPYGFGPEFCHLTVWSKSPLPNDESGFMKYSTEDLVDEFVKRTFAKHRGRRIWWANPQQRRSVEAIDHFHVLLDNPAPGYVAALTRCSEA